VKGPSILQFGSWPLRHLLVTPIDISYLNTQHKVTITHCHKSNQSYLDRLLLSFTVFYCLLLFPNGTWCFCKSIKNIVTRDNNEANTPLRHLNVYNQTCVQRPPLRPGKSGRCSEVVMIQRFKLSNIIV